jgi:hypothetical protein
VRSAHSPQPLLPLAPSSYSAFRPYWRNLGSLGAATYPGSDLPWWVKGAIVGVLAHAAYRGMAK